jgi:cytochrome b involved in lipid metabolism
MLPRSNLARLVLFSFLCLVVLGMMLFAPDHTDHRAVLDAQQQAQQRRDIHHAEQGVLDRVDDLAGHHGAHAHAIDAEDVAYEKKLVKEVMDAEKKFEKDEADTLGAALDHRHAAGHSNAGAELAFYKGNHVKCPARQWAKAELHAYAEPANLLIAVNRWVLNVTDFLPNHPGGKALMAAVNGEDGADVFTHYHQPSMLSMFSNFCVGTLA